MKIFTFTLFGYIIKIKIIFMDAARSWQLGFQDPATPIMEGILDFHHHLLVFLIPVAILVCWLLARCLQFYQYNKKNSNINAYDAKFTHSTLLEIVWTLVPAFILMIIAIPSFALLYSMEENAQPSMTLKVVGHQWYWSYQYPDIHITKDYVLSDKPVKFSETGPDLSQHLALNFTIDDKIKPDLYYNFEKGVGLNFDSYMTSEDDLILGGLRLLEVDRRVCLPEKTHIRVLVTAADVLHSWAIPSFGLKVDACPGRLNQTSLYIKRQGLYFGQCSEICGVNHGFMPIVVKAMSKSDFHIWRLQELIKPI